MGWKKSKDGGLDYDVEYDIKRWKMQKRHRIAREKMQAQFRNVQTIDNVVLVAGNKGLVKNQPNGTTNGIYDVVCNATAHTMTFNTNIEHVKF